MKANAKPYVPNRACFEASLISEFWGWDLGDSDARTFESADSWVGVWDSRESGCAAHAILVVW